MNGTRSSFVDFMNKLNKYVYSTDIRLVICPPFTLFLGRIELNNNISLGAQNCHHKRYGSYTGEISAEMLHDIGCTYVILGHSERHNETDNEIKLKAEAALEVGLHPIICVGEKLDDQKCGRTKEIIEHQCASRTPAHGKYTIAYEPVWAIGTGYIPDNKSIIQAIKIIDTCTGGKHVVYGGSVSSMNIEKLLKINTLSGILIGSASLDFDHFNKIIKKVEKHFT